jgi:hypothetical protein
VKYKGTLKDSFEEAGKGFGATYKFKYYPRIDYIFADEKMTVKTFESFLNSKILTIIPL